MNALRVLSFFDTLTFLYPLLSSSQLEIWKGANASCPASSLTTQGPEGLWDLVLFNFVP